MALALKLKVPLFSNHYLNNNDSKNKNEYFLCMYNILAWFYADHIRHYLFNLHNNPVKVTIISWSQSVDGRILYIRNHVAEQVMLGLTPRHRMISRSQNLDQIQVFWDLIPGGTVVKNPPANAGDTGLSPIPGRSHMPRSN